MTLEERLSREGMEDCPMCQWLNRQVGKFQEEFLGQAKMVGELKGSEISEYSGIRLQSLQKALNQYKEARSAHNHMYHQAVAEVEDLPW